jgi:hypothetical protein
MDTRFVRGSPSVGHRLKPRTRGIAWQHGTEALVAPQVACEFFELPRVNRAPLLLKSVSTGSDPDVGGQEVHAQDSTEKLYKYTALRCAALPKENPPKRGRAG